MPPITDHTSYWDHYASGVDDEAPEDAIKNAFGWTQWDGHGPGDELLGDPATALELGSGSGNAIAALATRGIEATGIDISPLQHQRANDRWGHLPGAQFVEASAVDFLAAGDRRWDAVFSIWAGAWFTDPAQLMPLVYDRLTPGGRFVFSHAPAVPGSYGVQGMYGNGFKGHQTWIYRWAYEPEVWADILRGHGYRDIRARVEPAPQPDHVGTLIVESSRGR